MSTDDYSSLSTNELWLLHQEIATFLTARLLERKQRLDAQLASLPRPTSAGGDRTRVGPEMHQQGMKEKAIEDAN